MLLEVCVRSYSLFHLTVIYQSLQPALLLHLFLIIEISYVLVGAAIRWVVKGRQHRWKPSGLAAASIHSLKHGPHSLSVQ